MHRLDCCQLGRSSRCFWVCGDRYAAYCTSTSCSTYRAAKAEVQAPTHMSCCIAIVWLVNMCCHSCLLALGAWHRACTAMAVSHGIGVLVIAVHSPTPHPHPQTRAVLLPWFFGTSM